MKDSRGIKQMLKCFFGFHNNCIKKYKVEEPNIHIYCESSDKYIKTIHQEEEDCNKAVVFFDKEKNVSLN